jgi:hypothetical protein
MLYATASTQHNRLHVSSCHSVHITKSNLLVQTRYVIPQHSNVQTRYVIPQHSNVQTRYVIPRHSNVQTRYVIPQHSNVPFISQFQWPISTES